MAFLLDFLKRLLPTNPRLTWPRALYWSSISPHQVLIQQPGSLDAVQVQAPAGEPWDMEDALKIWRGAWQKNHRQRRDVRVLLSDHWVRSLALALPIGMHDEEDISRFVQAEFKLHFGESLTDWHADWTLAGNSILVFACPVLVLERLRQTLSESGSRLAFLGAQSLETFMSCHAQRPTNRWWAMVSRSGLSFACVHEGGFRGYWNHPQFDPTVSDVMLRLERHRKLLNLETIRLEVIDPLRLLDVDKLRPALQTAGWKIQQDAAPIDWGRAGALKAWPQFVRRAFT